MKTNLSKLILGLVLLIFIPQALVLAAPSEKDKIAALNELNHIVGKNMSEMQAKDFCKTTSGKVVCDEVGKKYKLLSPNIDKIRSIVEGVRNSCEQGNNADTCASTMAAAVQDLGALGDPLADKLAKGLSLNLEVITIAKDTNAVCGNEASGPDACIQKLQESLKKLGVGIQANNPEAKKISFIMGSQVKIFQALSKAKQACEGQGGNPVACLQATKDAEAVVVSVANSLPNPSSLQELYNALKNQEQIMQVMSGVQSSCQQGKQKDECLGALQSAENILKDNPAAKSITQNIENQISQLKSVVPPPNSQSTNGAANSNGGY
ncbi:MAG: hypothetical protein HY226_05985 [Candidatus Vogelbacteria bacterium]|nr:hypothetical protein [Candidatus Vogelbacteria bacterium]